MFGAACHARREEEFGRTHGQQNKVSGRRMVGSDMQVVQLWVRTALQRIDSRAFAKITCPLRLTSAYPVQFHT